MEPITFIEEQKTQLPNFLSDNELYLKLAKTLSDKIHCSVVDSIKHIFEVIKIFDKAIEEESSNYILFRNSVYYISNPQNLTPKIILNEVLQIISDEKDFLNFKNYNLEHLKYDKGTKAINILLSKQN